MMSMFALTFQLLFANSNNGTLEIDTTDQEVTENKNKDLDQYDTNLFNQDSKKINEQLKNDMLPL